MNRERHAPDTPAPTGNLFVVAAPSGGGKTSPHTHIAIRAESRAQVAERAVVLESELQRLEQEAALLRDQALLTRDPAVFSQSMDLAAGALEEHNTWLQDNAEFMQSLGEAGQTA